MPKAFEDCRKAGGRIRTISGPNKRLGLKDDEFMRVCFRESGEMVKGEKKRKVTGEKKSD